MAIDKVQSITYTTQREMLEEDRKSLIETKEKGGYWWSSDNSNWAREQFGENLTEKIGNIHPNGEPNNKGACNICGGIPNLDEKICQFKFSFCDEYGCGMFICLSCAKDIVNGFKQSEPKKQYKGYAKPSWAESQLIRASGLVEDVCEHGVGHPNEQWLKEHPNKGGYGAHGCDGCCCKGLNK